METTNTTRLYAVQHTVTGKTRLVQASNQAQALRHVASDEYRVSIPKPLEAVALAQQGIAIETVATTTEVAA